MAVVRLHYLTFCVVAANVISSCYGHGRLMSPPSRSSLWRFGFPGAVPNYNDNQLFCGGFAHQQSQGGKCGICGDPWGGPLENEAGGKYAVGIISRTYQAGQTIAVDIDITAIHLGWVEFRICPNDNFNRRATQACLNQYLLASASGVTRFSAVGGSSTYKLVLPAGLVCSQCVLQWKYHCGNRWGVDSVTGKGCVGCGAQEEFYGCADVAIQSSPTTTTTTTTTTAPVGGGGCRAAGAWAGQSAVDEWCVTNCALGHCPASHCTCD